MTQSGEIEKILRTAGIDEGEIDVSNLSLEALVLLINLERLGDLQDSTYELLEEIKDRQELVSRLRDLLKALHNAMDENGEINLEEHPELRELVEEFAEYGIEIDPEKGTLNSLEADRLIANIQMTIDDTNMQNDMQLQTVSRLTNERYQCYQMAKSIMKPLHDAKMSKARKVSGQ